MPDNGTTGSESHENRVNDAVSDGGGCAETWEALSKVREQARTNKKSRRTFLSGTTGALVTGVASVLGLSDSVLAKDEISRDELVEVAQQYSSPSAVQDAYRSYGNDLLTTLSTEGHIKSDSVSILSTDNVISREENVSGKDGVVVHGTAYNGIPTAQIQTTVSGESGQILIAVNPQLNRSYAIAQNNRTNNSDSTVYMSESPKSGTIGSMIAKTDNSVYPNCIAAQDCLFGCGLTGAGCTCVITKVRCCGGNCILGEQVDLCTTVGCEVTDVGCHNIVCP